MRNKSEFEKEAFDDKIKILLDEENEIKKWNQGILIKSLILLPTIVFIVGLFIVNKPGSLKDIIFVLLYPLICISLGLIILFAMRGNSK